MSFAHFYHKEPVLTSVENWPNLTLSSYVHQMLVIEELGKHGVDVEFLDRPMAGLTQLTTEIRQLCLSRGWAWASRL
jgi:hypothetical protein